MPQTQLAGINADKSFYCDTLIINTCGFIDQAKKESLKVIKEAVALKIKKKLGRLLVFGCLVQRYRKELEKTFAQVDSWWGIEKLPCRFAKHKNLFSPRHTGFLKICEGCLNKCSYCAIPLIKGSLISRPKVDIAAEAEYLDSCGIKELNIIGQDITGWGKDLKAKEDLSSLLVSILRQAPNIPWIRLFYTHPKHISDSLLDLIAKENRICKYIDLPIQHINDRILKLMQRAVTRNEIIKLIRKIREKIPGCVIRTSVIVGFPTETEKEFRELLDFIKDVKFERLGAFMYSREENTPAYNFSPQIHHKVKERRFNEVMALQQDVSRWFNQKLVGERIEVLVEEEDNGIFIGRTQYDGYDVDGVVYIKRKGLKLGQFYKVKITDAYEYDLVGV